MLVDMKYSTIGTTDRCGTTTRSRTFLPSITPPDSAKTQTDSDRLRRTQDSQIRVTAEENTKHVPHFSFIPIGTSEKTGEGWHWRNFVGVCLYPDSVVVQVGQHVVDDLRRSGLAVAFEAMTRNWHDSPRIVDFGWGHPPL